MINEVIFNGDNSMLYSVRQSQKKFKEVYINTKNGTKKRCKPTEIKEEQRTG